MSSESADHANVPDGSSEVLPFGELPAAEIDFGDSQIDELRVLATHVLTTLQTNDRVGDMEGMLADVSKVLQLGRELLVEGSDEDAASGKQREAKEAEQLVAVVW